MLSIEEFEYSFIAFNVRIELWYGVVWKEIIVSFFDVNCKEYIS